MTTVFLRAGELNRRIKLQQRSTERTSGGMQVNEWTDVATVWARIQPASGKEAIVGGALVSEATHTITIRYHPGVTTAMRALYGSAIFDILAVADHEMAHAALELSCAHGLTEG